MVISMKGFKERRMKLKKTVNLLLCFVFLVLISTFLLFGCKAQEETTSIDVEISWHYTKEVLVDGKLQTEYYLVFEIVDGDDFMVRVYPKTGWLMDRFEAQFPIGTIIEIKEKDKIPIPEVIK